ncbi:hypothetical protein PFICI_13821 [Pestalotiopsis fici W106-1]|uniref:alpha-galactosidase n=1 Tax=Pestalotiopsis fici (strain W106-1 / CGMCC3.15140) TaxID=1229662 RepID=W3WJ49_PESFW|nr:uncharacterized protein PFICI_13821 [Pestalotiopsis fici W106-1]ETS73955.1 hypothetical protein PFICI_13821 [Pestalotiopsis fici W106-1]
MLNSALLVSLFGLSAARHHLEHRATSGCYPQAANTNGDTLTVITTGETPGGFTAPPRGWNSWGIQDNPRTTPSYPSSLSGYPNETFILQQCSVLAGDAYANAGYTLCSIDGGWDSSTTDDYGRIVQNSTLFDDMASLASTLHDMGLLLGIYSQPNVPCDATNKTIYGTDILIGSTFDGSEDTSGNCYFNYSNPDTQTWHDTQIALWANWGVDMIKLDYITPGSQIGDSGEPSNTSAAAIAYHQAIINSGRQIRLDLSANVCRNSPYLGLWEANADSIRVAVDINAAGSSKFLGSMWKVQGTIEQYRQYINQVLEANTAMVVYPDLDNMFIGNGENVTGITDGQRITIASHWIGASANLILGSDMTSIDDLGLQLITSASSISAAEFCATYPMQPRNPGTGSNQAMQLQAWLSGPDGDGNAYVLLTNLGENEGRGGYDTVGTGNLTVTVSLADLGLDGSSYAVTDVWNGTVTTVESGGSLSAVLDDGNSQFLQLTPA